MADHIIEVRVDDKIATVVGDPLYVCGNSDYIVRFAFDAEWSEHDAKTARFVKTNKEYIDVPFIGNQCAVPILENTLQVRIGVYAGNLCTTTPAIVNAQRSILCGAGTPADPPDDVYNRLMQKLEDIIRDGLKVNVINAETLDGRPPEYYLPAVQLLDNPDFAIAQAGYNGLHLARMFHADRWEGNGSGTLSANGGVKTFKSNSGFAMMYQYLWNDGRDSGKPYTLAVTLPDGTRLVGSGVSPSAVSSGEDDFIDITAPDKKCWFMVLKGANNMVRVRVDASQTGASVSFKNIALYEGTYTADTVPPYVPPDPTLELTKCRNYYRKLKYLVVRPYNVGSSARYYRIAIEPPMIDNGNPSVEIVEPIETPINSWADTGATFAVTAPEKGNFTVSATGAASGSDFVLRVDAIICSDIK